VKRTAAPGGGLDAGRFDVHGRAGGAGAQQLLDRGLRFGVGALAEVAVAHAPVAVEDVQRRPVVVVERPPDRVVVVQDDRVDDAHRDQRAADALDLGLERELGRVRADDDQAVLAVAVGPGPDVGQRPDPVDARVGAELHRDDAAAQALGGQRLGVEPPRRGVERGQRGGRHGAIVAPAALHRNA
jgi:hypothetical protein